MRGLSVFAVIGALVGLWLSLVLMAISVPAYSEYLMPQGMYRNFPPIESISTLEPWAGWFGLLLYAGLWFLVAGRLNPALARLPFARGGKPLWAWAAWVSGGLLLIVPFLIVLKVVEPGFGSVDRLQFAQGLAVLVSTALAWMLVSPQAFGRFGSGAQRPWSKLAIARCAGLGTLFMLVFIAVTWIAGKAFMAWLSVVIEGLDRHSEVSLFGWTWLTIGMMAVFALSYAVIFGLLPAFVPGAGDGNARVIGARPALLLAAVLLAASVVILPMLRSVHYLGSQRLAQVVDFSAIQPLSLQAVKLCRDKPCRVKGDTSANPVLAIGEPVHQVAALGLMVTDGGHVPLHPDTAVALEQFVAEHRYSVLRKSAIMGATEVYQRLWQRDDATRQLDRFVERGDLRYGTILSTQLQLAWLVYASPINAGTRALLESLSDAQHYYIGSRAAVRLAAAWARFGDMTRAHALLEQARQASPGKFDHVQLVRETLGNGRLSGRIVLPGGADQVRLGLFRVTPDPTRKPEKSPAHPAAFSTSSTVRLTASAILGADGRFVLQDLGSGDYYLALLVPGDKLADRTGIAGVNVPDVIRLSAASPRRDLGTIRLTPQ